MHVIEAKGFRIPIIGLGTWTLHGRDCARLTEQAIRVGYRHIDTAQMYDNEGEVGEGVRASGKRNEVMVTTKVQPTMLAPLDLERSVKESLARLRLDVIDLLLIHWPNPRVPLSETLGAMAKMRREGYARAIGVSNFTVALLDEANKLCSEPLVCNQVECHPYLDQDKVIAAARDRTIGHRGHAVSAASRVTSCSSVSARYTKRLQRRFAYAGSRSRASQSFRAPARSSDCRRISPFSISDCQILR